MKYLIAISGPVASGKSVIAEEALERFSAHRISTRRLLLDANVGDDRSRLIEEGKRLDRETEGAWVVQQSRKYIELHENCDVIIIDAVRTEQQVRHLRLVYGDRVRHIHVDLPFALAKKRYEDRGLSGDAPSYEQVRADSTESGVWELGRVADRVVKNENVSKASLLALAFADLDLFPRRLDQFVDVLVGGQYGSEGKGNVVGHIAGEYEVLVRVGGPNAGHWVAHPKQKYVQLPSGTRGNPTARILIGAGATIWPDQILKEIRECELENSGRLLIDEQAMIIEQSDRDIESGSLESIASTKQGVGVATARKILNRGENPVLGDKVRLAQDHPDLRRYVGSVGCALEDAYAKGSRVMLEGTQGTGLSLHHGTWPYVTSRETTASGCLADAGISPLRVRRVVMVTRTYPIRVGGPSGPFGEKVIDFEIVAQRSGLPVAEIIKTEVGTISGNKRRIAEFGWEEVRRAAVLNGATDIALTFADYIAAENKNARTFEQLTAETRAFIQEVERVTNAKVSLIAKDFAQDGVIDRRDWN